MFDLNSQGCVENNLRIRFHKYKASFKRFKYFDQNFYSYERIEVVIANIST